jgi:hypothetical protein
MGLFDSVDAARGVAACWEWLRINTDRIKASLPHLPADVISEINSVFCILHPKVCVEIAPAQNGDWTFCLSADGRREAFPSPSNHGLRPLGELPAFVDTLPPVN